MKRVYDEWKGDLGDVRSLHDQGAAFVVAYSLEREGVIDLSDSQQGSLLARRPSADRLRELFRECEQTLWWMTVELGVRYSLVAFWLWEADAPEDESSEVCFATLSRLPLAERNLSAETKRRVKARRAHDTTE